MHKLIIIAMVANGGITVKDVDFSSKVKCELAALSVQHSGLVEDVKYKVITKCVER